MSCILQTDLLHFYARNCLADLDISHAPLLSRTAQRNVEVKILVFENCCHAPASWSPPSGIQKGSTWSGGLGLDALHGTKISPEKWKRKLLGFRKTSLGWDIKMLVFVGRVM